MTDERYDGLAHDMSGRDKPRADEQPREHSELNFGQVAVVYDVGHDAVTGVVFT